MQVKHKRHDLLKHPVTSELLKYKWSTYGSPVFIAIMLLRILFIGLLTALVLLTPLPQRSVCKGKHSAYYV